MSVILSNGCTKVICIDTLYWGPIDGDILSMRNFMMIICHAQMIRMIVSDAFRKEAKCYRSNSIFIMRYFESYPIPA
jgi:hypothetical protein